MVIFATGIRANLDFPKRLGLDIGTLGGVVVSPTLQPYRRSELVPDVFVAGDVIQCTSAIVQAPTLNQLGSSAVRQGSIAGKNAAGGNEIYGPVASPWVSVIGDKEMAGTGLSTSLAAWYKVEAIAGKATGLTRARYFPGASEMIVKLIADATTHKLIGAQIIAGEGTTGRINWLTDAIVSDITAGEFMVRVENAYSPPTSMVKDVVVSAAEDLCKKLK
jgi:NADH oxidase (H2O2-forming)